MLEGYIEIFDNNTGEMIGKTKNIITPRGRMMVLQKLLGASNLTPNGAAGGTVLTSGYDAARVHYFGFTSQGADPGDLLTPLATSNDDVVDFNDFIQFEGSNNADYIGLTGIGPSRFKKFDNEGAFEVVYETTGLNRVYAKAEIIISASDFVNRPVNINQLCLIALDPVNDNSDIATTDLFVHTIANFETKTITTGTTLRFDYYILA